MYPPANALDLKALSRHSNVVSVRYHIKYTLSQIVDTSIDADTLFTKMKYELV